MKPTERPYVINPVSLRTALLLILATSAFGWAVVAGLSLAMIAYCPWLLRYIASVMVETANLLSGVPI
jgi:hypothetical protein